MKLVASPTSPFARKIHIQLLEKQLPFEFHHSVPWDPDTDVTQFNPLGKVPALVAEDNSIWTDSPVIAEYIETLDSHVRLIPSSPLQAVQVRQIEALADGCCEAAIAIFLEMKRDTALQSQTWIERQNCKLERGIAKLDKIVAGKTFCHGDQLSIADLAIVSFLEWYSFRFNNDWAVKHPGLKIYCDLMGQRESFVQTQPQ